MSYTSPESLHLLRQQLLVGLGLNILCLSVEDVLVFHKFRLPSSMLKMTLTGHVFASELFPFGHCPAEGLR